MAVEGVRPSRRRWRIRAVTSKRWRTAASPLHRSAVPQRGRKMIYPTRRAIVLTAIGAPAALLVGLIAPGYWVAGGAWLALIFSLSLLDALIGPSRAAAVLALETPRGLGIASSGAMTIRATF